MKKKKIQVGCRGCSITIMSRFTELPFGAQVGLLAGGGIAFLILNPLTVVSEGSACARLRLGQVQLEQVAPGLNFKVPLIESLDCMTTQVKRHQKDVTAATSNIQDLHASLAVQWRVPPELVPRVRREYGSVEALEATIVAPKVEESFKVVSSTRTLDRAIGNRIALKNDWATAIRTSLAPYPIEVVGMDVVNLSPSKRVAEAIESKQVAEQEALEATNRAVAKQNEAKGIIEEAKGVAEANRLKAESLRTSGGSDVVRLRMLDAWEKTGGKVPATVCPSGQFWLNQMFGK